jgi:hypothetical protein
LIHERARPSQHSALSRMRAIAALPPHISQDELAQSYFVTRC